MKQIDTSGHAKLNAVSTNGKTDVDVTLTASHSPNSCVTDAAQASPKPLSLADQKRKSSNPILTITTVIAAFAALIGPYWLGRFLAVHQTQPIINILNKFSVQGIAFVAWLSVLLTLTSLALCVVESSKTVFRWIAVATLALEQLIAGISLLKLDFWYSTYVVYADAAPLANAINIGLLAAGFAFIIYAVAFIGLLIAVPKHHPLNVLTHSWASFTMFFVIEILAFLVALFGGFLNMA